MTQAPYILAGFVFESRGFQGLDWFAGAAVLLGIAAVVLVYTLGLRHQAQSRAVRTALLALRLGAILCVLLALAHPTWLSEKRATIKPILAVVLDDSQSMALPAAGNKDPPTRYDQAVNVLQHSLLPAVARTHDVRVFDVQGRSLDNRPLPTVPAAEESPLSRTLLRVQRDLRDQPVTGIVLLSDGRETAEGDSAVASALDQLRLPVYAVEIAKTETTAQAKPDLAIQAVSVNRRALVGNTVRAVVDIAVQGRTPTGNIPLAVLLDGRPVAAKALTLRPGEPVTRAAIEFTPTQPGQFVYAVQVGPADGEVNLENNRQTFPLTVRAKALTAVYVDGVLRWEGKFIRQALGDDPDINIVSAMRSATPGNDRGSPGLLLPEQLANIDVVILGDIEATYFSARELEALRQWVTHDGGGLVLTGGYRSFGPEGFGRTDLRQILPVEYSAADNPQIEQPFNLKLTDAGLESPIFHLSDDRVRDAAFYQALPALNGYSRIAEVKPGAEVLAVNPSVASGDGHSGAPVMVVQQVGAGRVLVFAVDTTWRWRMVVGGFTGDTSFYHRFWGQLVRWVARDEDPAAPQQLFLSTDRYRYKSGDVINLTVEMRENGNPSPASATTPPASADRADRWRLTALALHESGRCMTVPLATRGGGKYCAAVGAADPGRWDMLVTAAPAQASAPPASGGKTGRHAQLLTQTQAITVQVDRPNMEMLNTHPDLQWLARVAQMTGGQMLQPEQIAAWSQRLTSEPVATKRIQTATLWKSPWLIGLFLTLLCGEWLLRRRSRLF